MQKIQFTGLEEQKLKLRAEIDRNIGAVINHGQFILGPEVAALEKELAAFSKARHVVSVANGTDAIEIALRAFGVGEGDAVMVPSFTYTATAEVILAIGAKPVFVEVDEHSFNISLAAAAEALQQAQKTGQRVKALIAVDLFGLPADWAALNVFASKHDLHLIADAAQSFGASTAEKRFVGSLAPITTTSFFPAKPLGCYGDGGAIFTDDAALAEVMRSIRSHGQGKEKYETVRVGMNSRLDTLQAAILLAKLSVFPWEIEQRNTIAAAYSARLGNHVAVPRLPDGVTSAWAQYTIKVKNRDQLQAALKDKGVPTAIYYPKPMHLQKAYEMHGQGPGSLPVSERLSAEVLSLPMNPYCTPEQVEYICDSVISSLKA